MISYSDVLIELGFNVHLVSKNTGEDVFESNKYRIPISIQFSGNLFSGTCSAQIVFFEPQATAIPPDGLPGIFILYVSPTNTGDITCFKGFIDTTSAKRIKGGGYVTTFTMVGVIASWDVPCDNFILPYGASATHPSSTYTMSDALRDLIGTPDSTMGAESVSDILAANDDGGVLTLPSTNVLVADMYEKKCIEIQNSTYLAEIQRLASYLGLAVFQHPALDVVSFESILFPKRSFDYVQERCAEADFGVNYGTMPATILVVDDSSNKAWSFGRAGRTKNDLAYKYTGRNNLGYGSTLGLNPTGLEIISQELLDIGVYGSMTLKFKYAGLPPYQNMLGAKFNWKDENSNAATYVVSQFQTTYNKTSCWTEISAYLLPDLTKVMK